jgi:hypothetical protein
MFVVDSWKDFHDKTFGVLFQIVVPLKSIVGFVSNLKQFLFRRCRRFSLNFSIIEFDVRELHLPEVKGLKLFVFPQSKQSDF